MDVVAPGVKLLGKHHAFRWPEFCTREDLLVGWQRHQPLEDEDEAIAGRRLLRVLAAGIGLCTRLGGESKANYFACNCSVLEYGGKVYDWLLRQGVDVADIAEAGSQVLRELAALPSISPEAVKAKRDF